MVCRNKLNLLQALADLSFYSSDTSSDIKWFADENHHDEASTEKNAQRYLKPASLKELATLVIKKGESAVFGSKLCSYVMPCVLSNLFGNSITSGTPHPPSDQQDRQMIYNILLSFVQSCHVSSVMLGELVNQQFCSMYLLLFQSAELLAHDRRFLGHILHQVIFIKK
jgi:hypothetical protein